MLHKFEYANQTSLLLIARRQKSFAKKTLLHLFSQFKDNAEQHQPTQHPFVQLEQNNKLKQPNCKQRKD